jgi:hypothetical protein
MENSLIGLGGAVIGILLGHILTRNAQHEQWLRDNEKQEARELLTALYKILATYPPYAILISPLYGPNRDPNAVKEADEKYTAATVEFYRTMNDRLYIAEVVRAIRVKERWDAARNAFGKDIGDEPGLKAAVDSIRDDIIAAILGKNVLIWKRAWNRTRIMLRRK